LAQVAAIAAINDEEFLKKTIELNTLSLNKFRKRFDELSIRYMPTFTNFLLMLFQDEKYAAAFNEECTKRGLILRYVKAFGIPNGIRINSGTEDETQFALDVISEVHTCLMK